MPGYDRISFAIMSFPKTDCAYAVQRKAGTMARSQLSTPFSAVRFAEGLAQWAYFAGKGAGNSLRLRLAGGEAGIRTPGTGVSPYNGLANRRIRPLCHLSGVRRFILPRRKRRLSSLHHRDSLLRIELNATNPS